MTVQLMNNIPNEADFIANPESILKQLVVRALHRYVDDFVLRAIALLNPAVANTADGIDKVELSKKFIHNSQRAYWKIVVLNWARAQVLPAARNSVVVALT